MSTIKTRAPYVAGLIVTFLADVAYAQSGEFQNVLRSDISTVPGFIAGFLKALVMIALPIISLFVVYAGFKFISAQGNPEQLNAAKMNLVYVVIGAILILGAWVLATLIGGTVTQLTRGS